MNKSILCYIINGKRLYLEQVLAELDYPILCTCIDSENKERYISLCADPDEGRYIVAAVSDNTIIKMIEDSITMKEAFHRSTQIFEVLSDERGIQFDSVKKTCFKEISPDDLPDDGAYFELLESETRLKQYLESLKKDPFYEQYKHFAIMSDLCVPKLVFKVFLESFSHTQLKYQASVNIWSKPMKDIISPQVIFFETFSNDGNSKEECSYVKSFV